MSFVIPELESKGITLKDFYHYYTSLLQKEIYHLYKMFPLSSISNLKAYPLNICLRIIKQANTIGYVIEQCEDYVSANSLIRSLADSISSFILIYKDSNEEEKCLRHFLYIMDGYYEKFKLLPDELSYDGQITKDEFQLLSIQVKKTKSDYNTAYDFCERNIKELSIYLNNQKTIDYLISKRQWRYKTLSNCKESYTWKSMYELLGLNSENLYSKSFFSAQSCYVHGLSTSNLIIENKPDELYGIVVALLGKLQETLEFLYITEIDDFKLKYLRTDK
ncbi:MAG: hypothetical protein UH850_01745 [Paludibacteraceae bacterium]|nr:hypothetical protein [Paludibacteraceae bacterium]